MTGIAESQTAESLAAFQAGTKRKGAFDIPALTNNIYANKKRKTNQWPREQQAEEEEEEEEEAFQRGRYGFDDLGILRTKPVTSWLDGMSSPVYLESVVIGDLFDQVSLERALYGRLEEIATLPAPYGLHRPKIVHTSEPFEFSKPVVESKNATVIPTGTAILWIAGFSKSEVLVYGRKQGAPKGKPTTAKTR
ncbi:hypothetical protein BDB00DRAFT_757071 [Zychaea mexicana]|uniref:uncharacterized protein n=1 Tax=Zychaea mexicana TaxID=64656 RepID=UPI0022FE7C42|nr:uncharacterized protein BDB00DRAFT_757071 [Zychaea mexicana]KAI9497149.1 hypothetical protein BDB00DRAFT_757071 [Zychaea mexicana]